MIDNQHKILALTGASGAPYAMRLLECMLGAGQRVDIIFSKAAHMVFAMETDLNLPARPAELTDFFIDRFAASPEQIRVYGREDWMAPMASGSHTAGSMVVCPCTMGTLAAIAHGMSDNLIERAADVMIKENRQLILVPRETPFSAIHLENMHKLAQLGVTMLAANPGFYYQPTKIDDLVDFVVARILDQLQIEHALIPRWGHDPVPDPN
ncbi:Flavin prenyltransferase UbiX [hydrothermal vent metagenome]|uniref:flavin prenyltransferase n=1 Tax=hydrothermal vent metagenome TaxID=652676 RepID=A0A3B1AA15_9ZZZZ